MSPVLDLLKIAENLLKSKVLCVGDIMLDRFVYGEVSRISPEGPIPVLRIKKEKAMLGGVGNVIANLAAIGAETRLVSHIGADQPGAQVEEMLDQLESPLDSLVKGDIRPTTIKTRFIASNQQLLRTDFEETAALSESDASRIIAHVSDVIDHYDVVILSDYGKGVLSDDVTAAIIELATRAGKPVIVDPKGRQYTKYRGATLVTPNLQELSEATGITAEDDGSVTAAAMEILTGCEIENVLATRSQDGMSLISKTAEPIHIPTLAREVYDVSGAGDTVVALMAAAIGCGASLKQAAEIANIGAGIVVGKLGTAVVHPHELLSELRNMDNPSLREATTIAPLLTLEQAVEQVENWKAGGKSIGLTNGCFDLLHPGHISLLSQAAHQCDKLIVAINADDSPFFKTKGDDRPIHKEQARATVLGALSFVDAVILFDQDTPLREIKAINPDVLIKGADYTIDTVVGADHVIKQGGRVYLAALKDGFSTTNTVAKIRKIS